MTKIKEGERKKQISLSVSICCISLPFVCLVCGFFLVSFGLARLNRVFTSQKTKRKENGRPFRRPQNSKTTTTFQERRGVKVKSKPKNFGTQAERLLILWKNGMLRLGFYRFPLLLFWGSRTLAVAHSRSRSRSRSLCVSKR